jgi:hypothetical protein
MKIVCWIIAIAVAISLGALIRWMWQLPWGPEYCYLTVAAALGGLGQACVTGGDKLRLPRRVTDASGNLWDAGFLADIFIGILSGNVAIIIGMAVLSDRFFGTAPTAGAGGAAATLTSPPTWLRIVAFGILAGFAGRQLLPNLSKRITDLIDKQVEDKTKGVSDKVKREIEPKLDVVQAHTEINQLRTKVVPTPQFQAAAVGADAAISQLAGLVGQYAAVNNPDYNARVSDRMRIADSMVPVMTRNGVTSQLLAEKIAADDHKEWVLPLATLIAIGPGEGDAERLLDAVDLRLATPEIKSQSKFILYRVLLAIVALSENRRMPPGQVSRAKNLAAACQAIGDSSLRTKAAAVLDVLGR